MRLGVDAVIHRGDAYRTRAAIALHRHANSVRLGHGERQPARLGAAATHPLEARRISRVALRCGRCRARGWRRRRIAAASHEREERANNCAVSRMTRS